MKSFNVYEGTEIKKQECINHIGKRIYTGLKNLCKTLSKQKKSIRGSKFGSLTDTKMKTLQSYFSNAIRKNGHDLKAMKKGIFATMYPCILLIRNQDTRVVLWDLIRGVFGNARKRVKKHSEMSLHLRPDVVEKILAVYERLTNDDLLKRCTTIRTQNANESVHNSIWWN